MKTTILGHPRIGEKRELKKAIESYWKKQITQKELLATADDLKKKNWKTQKEIGIDIIPSNDFSFYDLVLDMCIMLGCIPKRFENLGGLEQYFAMARGLQKGNVDVTAMEMTKWFDTNYHYIVPEFIKNQSFSLNSEKIITEYNTAKEIGIDTKPVIIGPITFLLLGKEKEKEFDRIDLLDIILPLYKELINELAELGVKNIQIDEPILATDLTENQQIAFTKAYEYLSSPLSKIENTVLTCYFGCYGNNLDLALNTTLNVLHLDLVRASFELDTILNNNKLSDKKTILSLGIVDGRNIWKNNFEESIKIIEKVKNKLGDDRLWISSSCSLLHSPYDLELETNEKSLSSEVKQWLAFSKQKLKEIVILKEAVCGNINEQTQKELLNNKIANQNRRNSKLIHNKNVKERINNLEAKDDKRNSTFTIRQEKQKEVLNLPLFPTTTIGSFPQTKEVRRYRSVYKKGGISLTEYNDFIEKETQKTIRFQEEVGLDVLVHGEFERNDMVEYFGEQLAGFAFTKFGWVQSYGTRCVKPPIIFGDVCRPTPMTVKWSSYAQSLTEKPVKGMLTGPVTVLQWSFVRNDQPRETTCNQIAFAIRDEVCDLENAGIQVIQIDEPAFREGLPLLKKDHKKYLDWAAKAFRISSSGVHDTTQIHTHMCYSEFNNIIESIADMDADVITIETSRSEMELLEAFVNFKYPNEIGPGVYDIHSPRIPTEQEMDNLLTKASTLIPVKNLWVNPDCGLKTRDWPETKSALISMVNSAKRIRKKHAFVAQD